MNTENPKQFPAYLIVFSAAVFVLLVVGVAAMLEQGNKAGHASQQLRVAADQPEKFLPYLVDKRVGLVVNQASLTPAGHTIDQLLANGVDVKLLFALEHGLRGTEDAGAVVSDSVDQKTGLPIRSLYGKSKQPAAEDLRQLDVLVYDVQDVGVRFFTYISSMHYLMQACANQNVPLVIFDRPNPNGTFVDGPVLQQEFQSFVGMHSIPVLYGMTPGELARMINGEGWLEGGKACPLTIVPLENYVPGKPMELLKRPSPNLPNAQAIKLYASLALFEATDVSIGRGTYFPFQVAGGPDASFGEFKFTPEPIAGMSLHPRHEGASLFGDDLRARSLRPGIDIEYFLKWRTKYQAAELEFLTRPGWLDKLMGTDAFRVAVEEGWSAEEIRTSWSLELQAFKKMRARYLLY